MAGAPITLVVWFIVEFVGLIWTLRFLCEPSKISVGAISSRYLAWFPSSLISVLISSPFFFPKIAKLQESISRILALRFVNAKDQASLAGQLNSMFLAIGNIVRLMSRAMYAQISAQNS